MFVGAHLPEGSVNNLTGRNACDIWVLGVFHFVDTPDATLTN